MTTRAEFFPALVNRLVDAGYNVECIARKVGVSRDTVYSWRTGTKQPRYWAGHDLIAFGDKVLTKAD